MFLENDELFLLTDKTCGQNEKGHQILRLEIVALNCIDTLVVNSIGKTCIAVNCQLSESTSIFQSVFQICEFSIVNWAKVNCCSWDNRTIRGRCPAPLSPLNLLHLLQPVLHTVVCNTTVTQHCPAPLSPAVPAVHCNELVSYNLLLGQTTSYICYNLLQCAVCNTNLTQI